MPTITIDGREIEAPQGQTILKAALAHGIEIPYYCWHPYLSISGNCRICMVEIEGFPKLMTSCSTTVSDGMKILTRSPKVLKARKGVMEFLLLHHPIDCPICDQAGECGLQDYYMEHGLHESRMDLKDKLHKPKVVDLGPIVYDGERCILCTRCVRFMREVARSEEFGVQNRGNRNEITTYQKRKLESPYSCNAADICPVGALTIRDFRFKCRVWFLTGTPSVCPSCSTGCNITIDHRGNRIYRYLPRDNPDVNRTWICNDGRFSYKRVHEDTRIQQPMLRDANGELKPATWQEAITLFAEKLRAILKESGAGAVGGLASQDATNEDNFYFARLLKEVVGTPHVDYRLDDSHEHTQEQEDHLLLRKDKHPNSNGVAAMGCLPGAKGLHARGMIRAGAEGKIRLLHILQNDPVAAMKGEEFIRSALERTEFVVLQATHVNETTRYAHLVLPCCTHAEIDGTFTNYAGRVQRVRKAIEPVGESWPGWMILNALAAAAGSQMKYSGPEAVFQDIAVTVEACAGMSYRAIGMLGSLTGDMKG